jgi:uncharacterized protein (TIGR02001 family)
MLFSGRLSRFLRLTNNADADATATGGFTLGISIMVTSSKFSLGLLAALGLSSFATAALASDPTPAPSTDREFKYSFNIGGTNDYVFRGFAQNKENPSAQGGIDLTYGIAYFGLWASNVDFGRNNDRSKAVSTELDIYGGIKPVVGPATFDLGVIYYAYPGANDSGTRFNNLQIAKQDYVEFKGGVSGAFIPKLDKLTLGGTVFYSPEYQGKQGEVWTLEASAAYELPAIGKVTPTVSALIGSQYGDASNIVGDLAYGKFQLGNGSDSLTYWNVGVTLAVEKFSFDFRYWNTDISNANRFCNSSQLQCDGQFAFIGKFTY